MAFAPCCPQSWDLGLPGSLSSGRLLLAEARNPMGPRTDSLSPKWVSAIPVSLCVSASQSLLSVLLASLSCPPWGPVLVLPLLRDQILGPPVGQEGPVPLPTSQCHSCLWLWNLWGFSPRDLGVTCGWRLQLALLRLAASPSLSAPLGSSPIFPSGQLPQGQTRENKQKPKFLGTCGWRGLSVLSAGTGRSAPMLQPHAPHPGPAPGLGAVPTALLQREPNRRLCRH